MVNRVKDQGAAIATKAFAKVVDSEINRRVGTQELGITKTVIDVVSKAMGVVMEERLEKELKAAVSAIEERLDKKLQDIINVIKSLPTIQVNVPEPKPRKKSITYDGYGRPSTIEEQ